MKNIYKHFVKDVVWIWISLCHTNEVFRAANFKLFCCLKLTVIMVIVVNAVTESVLMEVTEVA